MAEFAVQAVDLTKSYGEVTALAGLDLVVPRHSLFGFLGPNGAGKTTTMRLLLGLSRPTSGRATVLGHDVVSESLEIRRRVGYLPQQPRFPAQLTARELLRYARGFFPEDADHAVEDEIGEALELVGLAARADRRVGGMSGGERQRLGIAQAQIHRPELLILDEPAAALDPLGRRDVLEVMRRLRETTTVLFSTHILDDVQRVADTVAILKDGRCVVQAPTDQLLGGNLRPVFSMTLSGSVEPSLHRLETVPWIQRIDRRQVDGRVEVDVTVSDEQVPGRRLLRTLLDDEGLDVEAFSRQRSELEDVFLEVVEGSGP